MKDLTWGYPKPQGLHYIARGSSYLKRTIVWGNQSEPTVSNAGSIHMKCDSIPCHPRKETYCGDLSHHRIRKHTVGIPVQTD